MGSEPERVADSAAASSLSHLQTHLFEESRPPEQADEAVVMLSAPGEGRECVEIARRVLAFADGGVPFDRMAVLLRSPSEYRSHLEEALERARIPAYFARGLVRPHPAGRAFLALLNCAAEGLSARRFAEYLSLGEVPDADAQGRPPPALPDADLWVAPDEEMVAETVAMALARRAEEDVDDSAERQDPNERAVTAGTLRAPRRWERLLSEAAVVGGQERWKRRLTGLANELRADLHAIDDPDGPETTRIKRDLDDLETLRTYTLPLLDALGALPRQASWRQWLPELAALASRALRHPDRVLSTLAELAPMGPVGPVSLEEVRLVLSQRLLELSIPPPPNRYGRIFVAPIEAARGLVFDVVFVPGLAERLFPRKIGEEPILLDAARRQLNADLPINDDRVAAERQLLRLAVGAASKNVVLSYPRLDLDQARPRVPSFYALEAIRAAEGRLPSFDELAERAERVTEARVGWPAPGTPQRGHR